MFKLKSQTISSIVIGISCLCAWRLLAFTNTYATNMFFRDEWTYFAPLFEGKNPWSLIGQQWGLHFLGLILVPSGWLLQWTHWNSRALCFACALILVVSSFFALYLKRKSFDKISAWDLLIPIIFLNVWQIDTIVEVPDPGYVIPVLFFMILCDADTSLHSGPRYLWLAILSIVSIFTPTGYVNAISAMVILAMDTAIQYREKKIRNAVGALSAMTAITMGLAVLLKISQDHSSIELSVQSLLGWFLFVMSLLSNTVGLDWHFLTQIFSGHYLADAYCVGAVMLSLIGYCFFRRIVFSWKVGSLAPPASRLALWGLVHGITMAFIIAIGRSSWGGLDATQWPRYYTCLIPLLFGLYLEIDGWERHTIRTVLLSGMLLLLVTANIPWPSIRETPGTHLAIMKRQWKDCYRKYENFSFCNQQIDFHFDPGAYPTQRQLDYLKKNHLNLFAD